MLQNGSKRKKNVRNTQCFFRGRSADGEYGDATNYEILKPVYS
jgi:hypothetical protein